jgi:hypothetical protein
MTSIITCACSHSARRHMDGEGVCEVASCGCGGLRSPSTTSVTYLPPQPVAVPRPGLLIRASRSADPAARQLGGLIEGLLGLLGLMLEDETKETI